MDILNEMFDIVKATNPVVEQLITKYNKILKQESSLKILTSKHNVYKDNYVEIQEINDIFFENKNRFDEFGQTYYTVLPSNFKTVYDAYSKLLTGVAAAATTVEKLKGSIANNMDTPWRIFRYIARMYKSYKNVFRKLRTINQLQQEFNQSLNLVLKG